jgi:hypothetical protein
MSERETVVELPFAADCCPCVEKLRTVVPLTVGIRDGVVHLVPTLGSVVISARAELGSIITSALPVATWQGERVRVQAERELWGQSEGPAAKAGGASRAVNLDPVACGVESQRCAYACRRPGSVLVASAGGE